MEQLHQLGKGSLVYATVLLHAVFGARLQLVEVPAGFGYADDGQIESLVADQRLQGGKDLFVG